MYTAAVIPVHNRACLVRKAIASIQKQTHPIDEIVVVDDGSTDATPETVTRLSLDDSRIRLMVMSKNAGASAARNAGIDLTECDWISFLDSDDQWMPEKHEKQLNALANRPDAIASFTGIRYQYLNYYSDCIAPLVSLHDLRRLNYLGTTSTSMVRRETLKKVGGFDTTLPSCQDWDLWVRLRSVGEFAIVPDPLVLFNHQPERTRISLDREALRTGQYQLLAKILKDVSSKQEQRIINAYHKVYLGECYLSNFKAPKYAMREAIKSLLLSPTKAGKSLMKRALRAGVRSLLEEHGLHIHTTTKK